MKQPSAPQVESKLALYPADKATHPRSHVPSFHLWRLLPVFALAVSIFLLSFFWLLGSSLVARAAGPHYVASTGTDSSNCLLSAPCRTIQRAINNAANGDEIRVAAGIYTGTLTLNKNLTLRGGYTTTDWFAPSDPIQNPTVIDAQNAGRVVYIPGAIVATVTGFHLTNGRADTGAGVYNESGTLTLSNNKIYGNEEIGATNGGGGVANGTGATLFLRRNQIYSNTTQFGGGGISLLGTAIVEANEIFSNSTQLLGGGVVVQAGNATLRSNLIYNNDATAFGGGGIYIINGNVNLENNTLYANRADDGGGIYLVNGTVSITNSLIISNTALTNGGGVYSDSIGSNLTVSFTDFFGNSPNDMEDGSGSIDPTTLDASNRTNSDPQFIDPQNFNLHLPSSGSPALDSGTTTGATIDFEGEARPFGAGMDRGADEYVDVAGDCFARIQDGELFTDVQAAVDGATSGQVVQVAGRCTTVQSRNGTAQIAYISKTLTIRGGYTVTDWFNASYGPTILDAQGAGRPLYITGTAGIAPVIENLHLTGGSADDGAGVFLGANVNASLRNNVIYDNTATNNGGGVYNSGGGDALLDHNTIYNNTASQGGGIYASGIGGSGEVTLRNSVVANNQGSGVESASDLFTLDYNNFNNNTPFNYNGPFSPGPNDISVSPDFVNPAGGDFHLASTSQLINAADPASSVATDFEDDSRPQGPRADIGADESLSFNGVELSESATSPVVVTDTATIAGQLITFTHTVTNVSNTTSSTDTFTISLANSDGWNASLVGIASPVVLTAGVPVSFDVVVSVPGTIPSGIFNQTIITVTSQTNANAFDTAVDIIANPNAELTPSFTTNADPGEVLTYTHTLRNTGPVTDTLNLSLNSPLGWGTPISPPLTQSITLGPNGTQSVIIRVEVPLTAPASLADVMTITATSVSFGFSASVTDTTTANATTGDRFVATTGNNTNNNCRESSNPCRNIKYAVSQAAWGDTVYVAQGTYSEPGGIFLNQQVNLIGDRNVGSISGGVDPTTTIIDAQNTGRGLRIQVPAGFPPRIENFTILNGASSGVGGGIYIQSTSTPTLTRVIVNNSSATRGGGVYIDAGNPVLQQVTISQTTATDHGGGIYINGGSPLLQDVIISQTTATNNGGAVYVAGGSPTISSSLIYNGSANNGGGVYQAGGTATISQTQVSSSTANNGGGFYVQSGNLILWNNFIDHNTATSGAGGGIYNRGVLKLVNDTLYGNQASTFGGGVYDNNTTGLVVSNTIIAANQAGTGGGLYRVGGTVGSASINYNDVWNNTATTSADSNISTGSSSISADPLFVDAAAGDLHLQPKSPAADVADPNTSLAFDLDGDIRPINQGFDMGADELSGCLARVQQQPGDVYGILQEAIDAAQSGQTVQISGTCRGVQPRVVNSQTISQTAFISQSLILRGGYDPTFTNDAINNPLTTTLDAQGQGRVVAIDGATNVQIYNLTLTGGDAAAAGGSNLGGGLYNANANVRLAGTDIISNAAAQGGGLYNDTGATLTLAGDPLAKRSTQLSGNTATTGGGLYNAGSSVVITQTAFYSNTASGSGGAVYNLTGLISTEVITTAFNQAANGAGFYNANGASLDLQRGVIRTNTATTNGGGVYNDSTGTLTLINIIVAGNSANSGAGLYNLSSDLTVRHDTFYLNNATTQGGGIYHNAPSAAPVINSTILITNTAGSGGGIFSAGTDPDFGYNDVLGNSGGDYGGIANQTGSNGNIAANPNFISTLFTNTNFLRIPGGSAVEDQGDPASPVIVDIDDDPRPSNRNPDIGVDEVAGCFVRINGSAPTYGNIQVAINNSSPGDEIRVAGVCRGVSSFVDGAQTVDQTAFVTKTLTIRGGYTTTNQLAGPSNPETNITVLDALNQGRVVYITNTATVLIDGLHLRQGSAANGGGVFVGSGLVTMTQNLIYSNTVGITNGGGLYNQAGTVLLTNDNVISSNLAVNGGAIYNAGGSMTVDDNDLDGNQATNGGAFYHAGGASQLQNNIIRNNSATLSGGVYNDSSSLSVWHNTFFANTAGTNGAGVYNTNQGSVDLRNNIFDNDSGPSIIYSENSLTVNYNDISPAAGTAFGGSASQGTGVLFDEPQLTADFHLEPTSPVIDQGDPAMTLAFDFDDDISPRDIRPGGQGFDMGADEIPGCRARIEREPGMIYGNIQAAVNSSIPSDVIQVTGDRECTGVHPYNPGTGVISQTVHITHNLTLVGGFDSNFGGISGQTTVNPQTLGRALAIIDTAAVTISNFILINGDATGLGGGPGDAGGGLFIDNSTVVMDNSDIHSNGAAYGGGVFVTGDSDLTLLTSQVYTNTATANGGGLYNEGTLLLAENEIFDNLAQGGQGGGVFNTGQITLRGNEIYNNRTTVGDTNDQGGGLYNANGSTATVDFDNRFYGNQAYRGGAIFHAGGDNLSVQNSFIYNNRAFDAGGAIYLAGGNSGILHNTFYQNSVESGAGTGGAIHIAAGAPDIRNNIFAGNLVGGTENAIHGAAGGATIDYNNYSTNGGASQVTGSVSAGANSVDGDPRFENPGDDPADFHLRATSPAIDQGLDVGITIDFEGDPRPINTAPDIGADEVNACLARLNGGTIYGRIGDALANANRDGNDRIDVAEGVCEENLSIDFDVTIEGSWKKDFTGKVTAAGVPVLVTAVDGTASDRVIDIANGVSTVNLSWMELTNGNTAGDGGGINSEATQLNLDNIYLSSNRAANGGGIYVASNATVDDVNGAIFDNEASSNGGAIYIASGGTVRTSGGVPIDENRANGNGGGVYVNSGNFELAQKQINNSLANAGGGIYITGSSGVTLTNLGLYSNTAQIGNGGGIYRQGGGATVLYHATIHENKSPNGQGGGVYNTGSTMVISTSIIAFNESNSGGSGIQADATVDLEYDLQWQNTFAGSINDLGGGVIGDPRLRTTSGDLFYDSAAIDAVPTAESHVTIDRVNDTRPQLCGKDIGRDEYTVGLRQFTWVGPDPTTATIAPTESVTYTFMVTNTSQNYSGGDPVFPGSNGYTETVTITVNSSENWSELVALVGGVNGTILSGGQQATVILGPGQGISMTVRTTVPAGTFADVVDTTFLSLQAVQCSGQTPLVSNSSAATTHVEESLDFEIAPDNFGAALPGQVLTYSHLITNVGNITDTYTIFPKAGFYSSGVIVQPPFPNEITLGPAQTSTLVISITINPEASGGLVDITNVIARSTQDPLLEKAVADTTAISFTTGTRHVSLDGQDSLIDETDGNPDPNAVDFKDNNCTQPDRGACRTIQHALSQAAPGDLIKIDQGTYDTPSVDIITATHNSQIITQIVYINKTITLQGGYDKSKDLGDPGLSGWDEDPPDHTAQSTILDMQGSGRGVFITDAPTGTVTLDQLVITNGDPTGLGGDPGGDAGGAIYNEGADVQLHATRIQNSSADLGGGLYSGDGNLRIQNSWFHDDTATTGGAVYVNDGSATFENNTFFRNAATGNGGGAIFVETNNPVISNTIFDTNSGYAISVSPAVNPTGDYNLYNGNSPDHYFDGTGVATPPGSNNVFADPTLVGTGTPPDLHVGPGSPALDAADPNTGLTIDYDNDVRPIGSFDIGADERVLLQSFRFYSDTITSTLANSLVVITHTLENTGETTDTYTLSLTTTQSWSIAIEPALGAPITLGKNLSQTVIVSYTIPATATGLTNVTIITASSATTAAIDTVRDEIKVRGPRWDIGKIANPADTVRPGDPMTYTLFITNTGDLTATTDFTITDQLPANTNFVSATPPADSQPNPITWRLSDDVGISETITVSFVVTVTTPLTDGIDIVNDTYSVTGGGAITDAFGSPVTVTVEAPVILTATKVANSQLVRPGEFLTYTITITNDASSASPAVGVIVTDTLPAGVVLQDQGFVLPADGTINVVGNTVEWQLTTPIQPDEQAQVTATVRVLSPLAAQTLLTNSFSITAPAMTQPLSDTISTPVTATNIITLQKTVVPTTVVSGGTVTYTIILTNSGDGIASVALTDTLDPALTPTDFITTVVVPGRTWDTTEGTNTVSFLATAPITPGTYFNPLITAAYDITQTTLSNTAPITVEAPPSGILLRKLPDNQLIQSGDTVTFTIFVTNTGDITLTTVTISDTLVSDCDATFTDLGPTDSSNYTCSLPSVTADFTNTAVVTGTPPLGTVVTDTDSAVVDVISPSIQIAKTPISQTVQSGDPVTFTIFVTNTGDITLTNINVTDPMVTDCTSALGDLGPGLGDNYTCSVTNVTASFTNTASVVGSPPLGNDVTDVASATVTVISSSVTITKLPDTQLIQSGDNVTFTISVTNTGSVTLTDVVVSDPQATACDRPALGDLGPGEGLSYDCSRLNVTVDFTNTAIVTGTSPAGPVTASDTAVVDVASAAILVTKTPNTLQARSGDTITFTITVTNTDVITIDSVDLVDPLVPACDNTVAGPLATGEGASYTCAVVIPADLTNTIIATATPSIGPVVTDTDTVLVDVIDPTLQIVKTVQGTPAQVGNPITFTIIVTNTGDAPLTGITVGDPLAPNCNNSTLSDLNPGESDSYTCSEVAGGADFTNMAVVTGTPPVGPDVTANGSVFVDVIAPAIQVIKSPATQDIQINDPVTFTISVTNTGDITLTTVQVVDPLVSACDDPALGGLDPGQGTSYLCSEPTVTADFTNTVVVTGTPEVGGGVVTDTGSAFVNVANPAIQIAKTPDNQFGRSGDPVTFTITVTNAGDVTLDPITITDTIFPACDNTALGPLAATASDSYTCSAPAGATSFTNTVVVSGTPTVGAVVTGSDEARVTIITPTIQIVKEPDSQFVQNGDPVTFTLSVTNTGDITLTNIVVSDPQAPACEQPVADLAAGVGTNFTCSVSNVTTAFTNTATVTGTPPVGAVVTATDTAFVDVVTPSIRIAKSPDNQDILSGDMVTFTINVTNTGDITLPTVTISDTLVPDCDTTITDFGPTDNNSYTCSLTNVTADFTNTIVVTGITPIAGIVVTDTDDAFVNVAVPEVTIVKRPDTQFVQFNDTVTFTISLTNTGDVALIPVTVTDVLAPNCDTTVAVLPVSGGFLSYTCTVSNVTADFTNTVVITGVPTVGGLVTNTDTAVVDVITPSIQIAKTPLSQTVQTGSAAIFTITVTNTGDVTLPALTISDPLVPDCNDATTNLGPGLPYSYQCTLPGVTSAFTNTAVVTGTPPVGPVVTATAMARVNLITPAITISKTPDTQIANAGDPVTFTITVSNTGDGSLSPITITDVLAPDCDQVIPNLGPGSNTSYDCSVTAGTTDFTNTVVAVGQPSAGNVVTDSDTAFVDASPPARPTLISPPNQSYTNDPNVTFVWSAVVDAMTYTLRVSGTTYDVSAPTTSFTPPALADGIYDWTVRSIDIYSRTLGYTDTWTVTVDTTPPTAPTLLTPLNGAVITATTQPTFDWSDSFDALSGPVTYTLTITDSGGNATTFTTTASQFTLPSGLSNGTYTWTVQAYDRAGNVSSNPAPFSLTMDTTRIVYLPFILKDLNLARPDLIVTAFSATPNGDGSYAISVTAINNSAYALPTGNNFHIGVYLTSDLNTPVILFGVQDEWFPPGQGRTLTANYTFSGTGTFALRAWADPFNVVVESNDANNTRDLSVQVTTASGNLAPQNQPAGPQPTPTNLPK